MITIVQKSETLNKPVLGIEITSYYTDIFQIFQDHNILYAKENTDYHLLTSVKLLSSVTAAQ